MAADCLSPLMFMFVSFVMSYYLSSISADNHVMTEEELVKNPRADFRSFWEGFEFDHFGFCVRLPSNVPTKCVPFFDRELRCVLGQQRKALGDLAAHKDHPLDDG